MNAPLVMSLAVVAVLAGCGGSTEVTCDEGPYLAAVRTPKVESPDGLDNLDPINEMPLPQASPQEPRPKDGSCLDQPPVIIRMD
jgi:uncharacterized lipoprotein